MKRPVLFIVALGALITSVMAQPIDRQALVRRHNVRLTALDKERPLQVGNGRFAFGMDVTGFQTFTPFNTMSDWGWHSGPFPTGTSLDQFKGQVWETHGRPIRYWMPDPAQPALSQYLASSPHRVNLGRLALVVKDGNADLKNPIQTLDLWTGVVVSQFELGGQKMKVTTACHPERDILAFRIESEHPERLGVRLSIPGNNPLYQANFVGDWENPGLITPWVHGQGMLDVNRRMDELEYRVSLRWKDGSVVMADRDVTLSPHGKTFEFVAEFGQGPVATIPSLQEVFKASEISWPKFWKSGGAIDLSGSADPRWRELERRIVLSQYLMAVNESGDLPPQESGLVNNGWYGRFHYEMIWWHLAHQFLWNREERAAKPLGVYQKFLQEAKLRAREQGYKGARWPKCTGPDGREWPHEIHALLIWQQPHPIAFAELEYRRRPTAETVKKWWPIVEASADFMASYAHKNPATGKFDLGPPLHAVSENVDPRLASNTAFELGYWRYGLRLAQTWAKRAKAPAPAEWAVVEKGLAPLPVQDGFYVLNEGIEEMWTKYNFEHPALLGTLGVLPGDGVDRATMARTLDKVLATWQFERVWGWDFPMVAMNAARLGKPEVAVDMLLHKSGAFQFDDRGLATGGPFPYFPSNGGLLYAVAMMATGWDGAPRGAAPGFPKTGWKVRVEGLSKAP